MDLNRKNILIVGLGISGIAAARFAQKKGASVTVTDMADEKKQIKFPKSYLYDEKGVLTPVEQDSKNLCGFSVPNRLIGRS